MGSGRYAYLSGIIPVMIFEYFAAVIIFRYGKHWLRNCFKREEDDALVDSGAASFAFQHTYSSYNRIGNYILLFTRLISLGYMCGVSVIYFYIDYCICS